MTKWTNEQYDAITKSGSNIIVSAGAGSGKTEVLSERVIEKLKNGIHIDELLILTFTRAAAEEMKDRIRLKIKSHEDLKEELTRIDSAYITTFDSYALSIVKKYHYLINIKKDIDITDASIIEIATKKILDEVFMEHYDTRDEKFLTLVDKYSVKNDTELRSNIISLIKHIDGYINKDAYLNKLENALYDPDNIEKIINKFISYVNEKKRDVLNQLDEFKRYFDENYIKKVEEVILKVINANYDDFARLSDLNIPSIPKGTDDEDAKTKKQNLVDAFKCLMSLRQYGTKEDLKNDILSTKEDVQEICSILKEYYAKFKEYKQKFEIYSFQDIAEYAINIFKTFDSARLEVKNSIKEIMIDEYQDTNDIQEEFISLIANNNVYMVGDIKQSIYQFRGSNPTIFKNKYSNYSANNGGIKIDLVKNFRSREEVLSNINSIFTLLMDQDLGGADYFLSHAMQFGNSLYTENQDNIDYNFEVLEYVKPENSNFTNAEIEIFAIARDIQNRINNNMQVFDKKLKTLRPFTYSDAVIILDRSKYFDDYKRIFEYLNIPLTIEKDGKLNASIDIELIKNIFDLIIHIKENNLDTNFKFDFLSIGRSFLYEYTDQYLFDIIKENKYRETKLYQDFSNIENYNSLTPYSLYSYILNVTDLYNKIYKVGDYENMNVRLNAIGSVAESYSQKGFTIEEFKEYLDEIIKSNLKIEYKEWKNSSNSVKIITIHKSKGLEYPICYFADLDHKFNEEEIKSKFIADKTYGLITPLPNDKDSFIKLLYKNDYRLSEIDEKIRLFYVALTRAKEKIVIVIPEKETEKYNKNKNGTIDYDIRKQSTKPSNFIYMVKEYLPKYFYQVNINNLKLTKNYLYNNTSNIYTESEMNIIDVKEIAITNDSIEDAHYSKESTSLVNKDITENMEYGTKIHELLEYIDFTNYNEEKIEDSNIRNKITAFIKSLGDLKDANIYKEYEFYYHDKNINHHGIIDLMIERQNKIDIIDYKLSNISDDKYKEQLNGYKTYISTQSNKPITTYLYSIITGELKEI